MFYEEESKLDRVTSNHSAHPSVVRVFSVSAVSGAVSGLRRLDQQFRGWGGTAAAAVVAVGAFSTCREEAKEKWESVGKILTGPQGSL